jgi:hypothetical protein
MTSFEPKDLLRCQRPSIPMGELFSRDELERAVPKADRAAAQGCRREVG